MTDIAEVARSIQLMRLCEDLRHKEEEGTHILALTAEPPFRLHSHVGNIVVAFGSYDPLSIAHESLFLKGLAEARKTPSEKPLSELLIAITTQHWNKPIDPTKNMAVYDRLHSLEGFASCYGNVALGLFNNPLFANLAEAIDDLYWYANIHIIVGTDVLEKIADRQGYIDRDLDPDEYIDHTFSMARFLVSERRYQVDGSDLLVTADDVIAKYPHLKAYTGRITPIDIRGEYPKLDMLIQDVSSSYIRKRRFDGRDAEELEAVGISDFVGKRNLYVADSLQYAASVAARERYSREHADQPPAAFIRGLMDHLTYLETDQRACEREVAGYASLCTAKT